MVNTEHKQGCGSESSRVCNVLSAHMSSSFNVRATQGHMTMINPLSCQKVRGAKTGWGKAGVGVNQRGHVACVED